MRILVTFLAVVFLTLPAATSKAIEGDLVKLGTYWNTSGTLSSINPDENLLVSHDSNLQKLLFTDIATGELEAKVSIGEDEILVLARVVNNDLTLIYGIGEAGLFLRFMRMSTDTVILEAEGLISFTSDDKLVVVTNTYLDISQIIEVASGEVKSTFDKAVYHIAPDGRFISTFVTDGAFCTGVAQLIEVETSQVQGEYTGCGLFSPNSEIAAFADWQTNKTQMVEVASGEVLQEIVGTVSNFSPDGRYLVVYGQPSTGLSLIDALTGDTLTEFSNSGWMQFNQDSTIAVVYDIVVDKTSWLELPTGEILFEMQDNAYRGFSEDGTLGIADNANYLALLDFQTGEVQPVIILDVIEISLSSDNRFLRVNTTDHIVHVVEVETGNILATGIDVIFDPTDEFVFVSQGLFVDVYGSSDSELKNVLPVSLNTNHVHFADSTAIYTNPDASSPVIFEAEDAAIVLGQHEEWGYVTAFWEGSFVYGWVELSLLELAEPTNELPILDPNDLLGSLQKVAETQ